MSVLVVFPRLLGIILGLSRWNFSQPLNYFWQIMHDMRCGGVYLFFMKSKSPVGEPSVKLSTGHAYNTVLHSSSLPLGWAPSRGLLLKYSLLKIWETKLGKQGSYWKCHICSVKFLAKQVLNDAWAFSAQHLRALQTASPTAFSCEMFWVTDGGNRNVIQSFLCWHTGLKEGGDDLTGSASLLYSWPIHQSLCPLALNPKI